MPTLYEIQKTLVDMGDKPKSFYKSREWIGSFELSLCLDQYLGMTSKIIHCTSGSEVGGKIKDLVHHFDTQGTPVMIGGAGGANTLLGVSFNENTNQMRFLILDPHYPGKENLDNIIKNKWIAWHDARLFVNDSFYNFCLPQLPKRLPLSSTVSSPTLQN